MTLDTSQYNFEGSLVTSEHEGVIICNYMVLDLQSWYENSALVETNQSDYEPMSLKIPMAIRIDSFPNVSQVLSWIQAFNPLTDLFPVFEHPSISGSDKETGYGPDWIYTMQDSAGSLPPLQDIPSLKNSAASAVVTTLQVGGQLIQVTPNSTSLTDTALAFATSSALKSDGVQKQTWWSNNTQMSALRFVEYYAVIEQCVWISQDDTLTEGIFNNGITFTEDGQIVPLIMVLDPELNQDKLLYILDQDSTHIYKEDLHKTIKIGYEIPDYLFTTDIRGKIQTVYRQRYLQNHTTEDPDTGELILPEVPAYNGRWYLHLAQLVYFQPSFIAATFTRGRREQQ